MSKPVGLTREELTTMFGVQHGTRLSEWPFEIPPENVQRILDTDAVLRAQLAERDARIVALEEALRSMLPYAGSWLEGTFGDDYNEHPGYRAARRVLADLKRQ